MADSQNDGGNPSSGPGDDDDRDDLAERIMQLRASSSTPTPFTVGYTRLSGSLTPTRATGSQRTPFNPSSMFAPPYVAITYIPPGDAYDVTQDNMRLDRLGVPLNTFNAAAAVSEHTELPVTITVRYSTREVTDAPGHYIRTTWDTKYIGSQNSGTVVVQEEAINHTYLVEIPGIPPTPVIEAWSTTLLEPDLNGQMVRTSRTTGDAQYYSYSQVTGLPSQVRVLGEYDETNDHFRFTANNGPVQTVIPGVSHVPFLFVEGEETGAV